MDLKLNSLKVQLKKESNGVRVLSARDNVIFPKRDLAEMKQILQENFDFVRGYFEKISSTINAQELDEVCLSITLGHLYVYNINRQVTLKLSQKDITHPQTDDVIFGYFKKIYPKDWLQKSANLMGIGLAECQRKWEARERFMDR